MKERLRHVGIVTDKIEESIRFYSNFFNFRIVNDQVESGKFISLILGKDCTVRTVKMTNESFVIELLSFVDFKDRKFDIFTLGCTHIALTVKSSENIFKKLSHKGVDFISPPEISQDGKARVCFLKDPNNNFFIEIVEELEAV